MDSEDYIMAQRGEEREILLYLHSFFIQAGLKARLRYGLPFYDGKKWICYLNPLKKGGVELVFVRGREFVDPTGLLEGRGRKMVRGVIWRNLRKIPEEALQEILSAALRLDQA